MKNFVDKESGVTVVELPQVGFEREASKGIFAAVTNEPFTKLALAVFVLPDIAPLPF